MKRRMYRRKVKDHNLLVLLFVKAVCERGGRRLVYDALDVKAGDFSRVLGRLALRVGKVRGNRNDCFGNRGAEICLGVSLELLQDHRGYFLRGEGLVVYTDLVVGTHVTLNGHDSAVGVGDSLALRHLADHALACLRKCHDRRGSARTFGVRDDFWLAAFKNGDARVSRT